MSEDTESLIDRIYEATAFPEFWPEILGRIARLAGGEDMVMLASHSSSWTGHWDGFVGSPRIHSNFPVYVNDQIAERSLATPRLIAANRRSFICDSELFDTSEWRTDPHPAEWSTRYGWNHAAATVVRLPSREVIVFHIERKAAASEFARADLLALDRLRPHLSRASLLSTRWRLESLRSAVEALAVIGLPAATLDRAGRIVAANALMEKSKLHVICSANDRIALADRAADSQLRSILSQVATGGSASSRSIPSRPPNVAKPAVVHVMGMARSGRDFFGGAIALLVLSPLKAVAPDLGLIRGLFGLTPSEARVAKEIAESRTMSEIAARYGLSRETVRSQSKAVFAKMGARDQREVAALIAGLISFPLSDLEGCPNLNEP